MTFRLALAACAALAACSAPSAPQNGAEQNNAGPGGAAAPTANAAAIAAARSACDVGATCVGPLLVRADRATLTPAEGDINTTVSSALSIANRSNEEVRLILVDTDAVLTLDNGAQVSTNSFGWTGIQGCRGRSGQQCLEADPAQFLVLAPGDSPARLTATLGSQVPPALRATLGEATRATLTFTLFVAGPGGGRQMQVSVPDIAIENRIGR